MDTMQETRRPTSLLESSSHKSTGLDKGTQTTADVETTSESGTQTIRTSHRNLTAMRENVPSADKIEVPGNITVYLPPGVTCTVSFH